MKWSNILFGLLGGALRRVHSLGPVERCSLVAECVSSSFVFLSTYIKYQVIKRRAGKEI